MFLVGSVVSRSETVGFQLSGIPRGPMVLSFFFLRPGKKTNIYEKTIDHR